MFSWRTFFQGFNIFNGQSFGKMLFYVIIAGIVVVGGIGIYDKLFLQKSVLVSDGGHYTVNEEPPKQDLFGLGCANLKVEVFWKKTRPAR